MLRRPRLRRVPCLAAERRPTPMKLKCLPEDFQVQEQIALAPGSGPFALYRLTKSSLGTPEAIDAIVDRWRLRRGQIAFAGLKDKHALTQQFVTIHSGPRRG